MLPVYYTDTFLEHLTGPDHYERPARLTTIVQALKTAPFCDLLEWREPPAGSLADIARVHPPAYIETVKTLAESGGGMLDPDTPVSPKSYAAALLAVGAWIEGTRAAIATNQPAFVLCRPPGHHAEPSQGMGFCLFANAAIAALNALDRDDIHRVAVFDWDVHHGNGTQAIFWDNPNTAYASIHQSPLYPGTGKAEETGAHNNICNVPMPAGSTWADYKVAVETRIVPFIKSFNPDVLLVSAGFDCGEGDPLAEIKLPPSAFGAMAALCLDVTPRCMFGLEGGYLLENLERGWLSVTEACLKRVPV
ncbi:histone deacetylase [Synechococcus sp. PCC 7336]|uniref:histone deacetylase family protein n=1 Tax=Synechococcus sp. PCC 7336 TaxID=195250 RepID=UPI00034CE29F|nr:histone deacetylase [Synechococcus sp. PCC 7336]